MNNNRLNLFLLIICFTTALIAEEVKVKKSTSMRKVIDSASKVIVKDVSTVDKFKNMFEDAKVSGQVKMLYGSYDQKKQGSQDTYATALGGILKYELAQFNGFNAGVALYTSYDIPFATGQGSAQNSELSSSKGHYTDVHEAFINYQYNDFNFRAGRQTLDTPLADSDDIRIIQNTFEAYVASYDFDAFHFMAGRINNWQGFDADLDDGWNKTGQNGTNFLGAVYSDTFEYSLWYYNITDVTNAFYADIALNYDVTPKLSLNVMAQYLKESELAQSGYDVDIYGAMTEVNYKDLGVYVAYNATDASNQKQSFSGTGGGTLYTSMDTMILDVIAIDRKAQAFVSGISYNYNNFNFLYAYAAFIGKKNSSGQKADIVEQDIGFEYNINDQFILSAIYVMDEDRQNSIKTENDWNRAQVMLHYNF